MEEDKIKDKTELKECEERGMGVRTECVRGEK